MCGKSNDWWEWTNTLCKTATEKELISLTSATAYNGQFSAIKSMPFGLCMMSLVLKQLTTFPVMIRICDAYSLGNEGNYCISTRDAPAFYLHSWILKGVQNHLTLQFYSALWKTIKNNAAVVCKWLFWKVCYTSEIWTLFSAGVSQHDNHPAA